MVQQMSREDLLREIGRLVLTDSEFRDGGWRALSLVLTFQPGVQSTDGFWYPDDGGKPSPALPEENMGDLADAVEQLRAAMAADTGKYWHQMLYQIWMPGPDFAATFEYDRPDRWSLGGYSAEGVASFAQQVDPARGRPGG